MMKKKERKNSMRVISLVCLLVFGGLLFSAPLPAVNKERKNKYSFSGEWDMNWNGLLGVVDLQKSGYLSGYWNFANPRWVGSWEQEETKITFKEKCINPDGSVGREMSWVVTLETQADGSFAGMFQIVGGSSDKHPFTMKRVSRLKQ